MNRILYLGYYIKQLDFQKFKKFSRFVRVKHSKLIVQQVLDILFCVFRYNISILEYFYFGFFRLNFVERKSWAGTGFMYEYQRIMNPPAHRDILDDKRKFAKSYAPFIKQFSVTKADILKIESENNLDILSKMQHVVFKSANGKCGLGVAFENIKDWDVSKILSYMEQNGFDLMEQFIEQHPLLQALSPSGVNTVRIFTQLEQNGKVVLLGCRLRISVNSKVDNLAAGNLAAAIDDISGMISSPAVYSDITKQDEVKHPITGVQIVGFQVPFWQECIEMVKNAAKMHPQNRTIGWDIAITESGPTLIEGNHDWCKLLWQLPVKQGLKPSIEKYI